MDFDWLLKTDPSRWEPDAGKASESTEFSIEEFLRNSSAIGADNWRVEFDTWGANQTPGYRQMPAADNDGVQQVRIERSRRN